MRSLLTQRISRIAGQLPLEDFSPEIKQVVVGAIRTAWLRLLQEEGREIASASENYITACLQAILNELRADGSSGFSGSLFETVVRDASETNYVGNKLSKQPDLTFRQPTTSPGLQESQLRAIVVECKIVGKKNPIRIYCREGLNRFIDGDYAWAMPSGMMIAYARDSMTVPDDLTPCLKRHSPVRALPVRESGLSDAEPAVYKSVHERTWSYPGTRRRPGDIEILHYWLADNLPPE